MLVKLVFILTITYHIVVHAEMLFVGQRSYTDNKPHLNYSSPISIGQIQCYIPHYTTQNGPGKFISNA
jgi:hypothetical protein